MALAPSYPTLQALLDELTRLAPAATREPPAGVRIEEGRNLSRVIWPNRGTFWLTRPQVRVIRALLDARLNSRSPEVDQATLIRASETQAVKLSQVFVGSGAWDVLVVQGSRPGYFRLGDLPPSGS